MIRRFALTLALVTALARAAQLDIGSDNSVTEANGDTLFTGHVVIRDAALSLAADEVRYVKTTDSVVATGHVILTRGGERLLADKLTFNRRDNSLAAESIRLGRDPVYVEGASAEGTPDEIVIHRATITYREPGPWQPTIKTETIRYSPGHYLRLGGASAGLGGRQFVPVLKLNQKLNEPLISYLSLNGGYRSSLGAFAETGLHLPVADGVKLGADASFYTRRGIMVGPSGTYDSDNRDLHGWFRTGYIRDHGDRQSDILGRPVPASRGYIDWEHQQHLADGLALYGRINAWKDSAVLRDFHPREFFPVQEPDNTLEAVYTAPNFFVSAFARLQPNSFDPVQERLPELRFDLLPMAIGGGFYERFNASAASLRERPPVAGLRLESVRLDAFYELSRPVSVDDWLSFTPLAGARVTRYSDTTGAASRDTYTRTLGELGFDTALRASGTYDYKNPTWKIDGLRHLVTPRLSYRYLPEGNRGRRYIPPIDRRTFNTYLPTLDLGDTRHIDDLHSLNTLRLGLDNTVQTRDPVYGSRDLFVFNVANDFRFKRSPGERDVSEVHTELALMPARWLEVGVYESFSPQSFTLREFNSSVTLRDGEAWSLRFANNFLRNQIQDYQADGRVRLNEAWEALARLRYNTRRNRFDEQSYGLVQNLANTWRIDYIFTLYSGPRRESSFGFQVQVDTIRF